MIDTPQLVGVFASGKNQKPEGDPPNREYADRMWAWIDRILSESASFDFLFVAGHYQVFDSRGDYDKVRLVYFGTIKSISLIGIGTQSPAKDEKVQRPGLFPRAPSHNGTQSR